MGFLENYQIREGQNIKMDVISEHGRAGRLQHDGRQHERTHPTTGCRAVATTTTAGQPTATADTRPPTPQKYGQKTGLMRKSVLSVHDACLVK